MLFSSKTAEPLAPPPMPSAYDQYVASITVDKETQLRLKALEFALQQGREAAFCPNDTLTCAEQFLAFLKNVRNK